MAAIAKITLPAPLSADALWAEVAASARRWAAAAGVEMRDAIVLVPFAQLLPSARRAFARDGDWQPRVATTDTLARSLAPAETADPLQISFDPALDRLTAARLLRTQAWAREVARNDPGSHDHIVTLLVQTAQALARAAAVLPPQRRIAHWAQGRLALGAQVGPGARERLIARLAFEWAAASAAPASDALFGTQPAAWIAIQAGGADALTLSLLEASLEEAPCLLIDTDPAIEAPFAGGVARASSKLQIAVCDTFEAEAQRSAAQVLAHMIEDRGPIALIAQDRALVRRVRALLARQGVPILDETGWLLSTTRAGATLASLLRAATPGAAVDDWLDWLKSCLDGWPRDGLATPAMALQVLESTLRRRGGSAADEVDAATLPDAAAALWRQARGLVAEVRVTSVRSMPEWLLAWRDALRACGAWAELAADDAGRQLIGALHLDDPHGRFDREALSYAAFTRWVEATLESASFLPAPPDASLGGARVVITPLERAMLRPFAAVVFPGADEKRFGAAPAPHPLLGEALAVELGLPSAASRRQAQLLAFAQILSAPSVTLLHRRDDAGEPLAASPLIELLGLALAQGGSQLKVADDPAVDVTLALHPIVRPRPSAAALLPARLSASACEALRACPYRFFAMQLLRLRAADELDEAVEKRDYGTWLHAVLHEFHRGRPQPRDLAADTTELQRLAIEKQQTLQLGDAVFLPYAASFNRLVPAYLGWLHERDAAGANWVDGERELRAAPEAWQGIEMQGVIDRVDSVWSKETSGPVTQLIDYKTGGAAALRSKVKQPLEDTQLAFYAALMALQSESVGDLEACYLPLDEGTTVKPIPHPQVEASARALVAGLGRDLARVRGGAAMPALGEGSACEHCDARGLCRRDHWAVEGDTP